MRWHALFLVMLLAGCQSALVQKVGENSVAAAQQSQQETAVVEAVEEEEKPLQAPRQVVEIRVGDKAPEPDQVTADLGATVSFINTGQQKKQILGEIRSNFFAPGERFEYTFEQKGEYEFVVMPFKYRGKIIIR